MTVMNCGAAQGKEEEEKRRFWRRAKALVSRLDSQILPIVEWSHGNLPQWDFTQIYSQSETIK